jgi:pimeloyl-ACP methyl ester carboxylesterase
VFAGDATFEALDPRLHERMLGNGSHFFSQELMAFVGYIPDAEMTRAGRVPIRLLVGRDGAPQLIRATRRLAEQLGLTVEQISGHHAPYLQQPEAFAEELRPILKQLSGKRLGGFTRPAAERTVGARGRSCTG